MDIMEEIDIALLAVVNNHISFEALIKVFQMRTVKEYLEEAIISFNDASDIRTFPYELQDYTEWLNTLKMIYPINEYPELYI
jgi:heme-binding NEAT domain protein